MAVLHVRIEAGGRPSHRRDRRTASSPPPGAATGRSRSAGTGPQAGDLVIQRFQLRREFVKALLASASCARTEASSSSTTDVADVRRLERRTQVINQDAEQNREIERGRRRSFITPSRQKLFRDRSGHGLDVACSCFLSCSAGGRWFAASCVIFFASAGLVRISDSCFDFASVLRTLS